MDSTGRLKAAPAYMLFILFASFSSFASLFAQDSDRMFQVVHLPRKAGYSKSKLNEEIALMTNKESVKQLLRLKNFPPSTTLIFQIKKGANQVSWWTIQVNERYEKEDNKIILQSRDYLTNIFYKRSDFKEFFKETVAVIDSLKIELYYKDRNYPVNKYVVSSGCTAVATRKKRIPFTGSLILTKELIADCNEHPAGASFYNENHPDVILASCKLIFLSAAQKETLLDLAAFEKMQNPKMKSQEIALLVSAYSSSHFGRIYFEQLKYWLEKNGAD